MQSPAPKRAVIRSNKIEEADDSDIDYELGSPSKFFGSHVNLVPLQSAVAGPRLFYGARFMNQAMPIVNREAPLVQTAIDEDPQGRSFDDYYGQYMGAARADQDAKVHRVTKDHVELEYQDGSRSKIGIYNNFPMNRKSVVGATRVVVIKAGQVWKGKIEDYSFATGDKVLSIDPVSKRSTWMPILEFTRHTNDKKLFRVSFASGRSVVVTEDHSLVTLDDAGEMCPILPLDCVIGITRSPVAKFPPMPGADFGSYDMGLLSGLYLSEGNLAKQKGLVCIAVMPEERAQQIMELINRVVVRPPGFRYLSGRLAGPGGSAHRSSGKVTFTDHGLYQWLEQHFGKYAHGKFISNDVLTFSREFLLGLVAGYMAGDGCLNVDGKGGLQLCAFTVSEHLRDDMIDVLSQLDVFATKQFRTHLNPNWRDAYGFRVIGRDIEKLQTWFFFRDRQQKLESLACRKFKASRFEGIPVSHAARKVVYSGFTGAIKHFIYKTSHLGFVAKHRVSGCSGPYGDWASSDVMWDAVVSIEPVEHEEFVYDFSVEKSEVFAVDNGLIVHNTGLTSRAIVKAGDMVKKDSPLTVSNFTDDNGTLAMGANARVGLVPYKGYSMDDSVVISEAFARRLSQEAMYGFDAEYRRGVKGGKSHHIGLFPNKFTKSQLDLLDDDGVIQVGQKVGPGDPLILASRPKVISSQQAQLGKLSSHMKNARADASTVWGEDEHGVVTDVKKLPRGVRVNVQVHQPTKVGDKIVMRSGQKSYHPDTEVLTERGWIKIPELLVDDRVASLFDGNVARFVKPLHATSYEYDGELCTLEAKYAAYAVTPNHRIWRKGHGKSCTDWYCLDAQTVHGTCQNFMIAAPFDLQDRVDPVDFVIAEVRHGVTGETMKCVCQFPFKTWVEFMALYLAEGNVKHADQNAHNIVITQKEKPFCREVERILTAMLLPWKKINDQYVTSPNKALRRYLDQFGKAHDKFVPQEIKSATKEMIQLFLATIWMCDGDKEKGRQYYTCSPRLRDDVQMLLAMLGQGSTWQTRSPRVHQNFEQYTINKLDQATTGTRKNYEHAYSKVPFKGPVFCLQVPGLGVVLTRFRGRAMWNGNSVVSLIVPDDHMPRTMDGKSLEMLLNPLGIPSRVNNSLIYELLLGKAAAKHGKPYRLNGFNKPGEKWYDFVKGELDKHGLAETDEVFDPQENRKLENPITTGVGHVLKLHHTSGCYDDQTEVLTESGWKAWPKVLDSDLLATVDGDRLLFEKPIAIKRFQNQDPLCVFSGRYLDYAVTPDHNMWASRYFKPEFEFVKASKVHGARFTVRQFGMTPPDGKENMPQELLHKGFSWGDFCELVGWWVSESCIDTGETCVVIYQSITANPDKCVRIETLLNRMGLKWAYHKQYGVVGGFRVKDLDLVRYFSRYGRLHHLKNVPREVIAGTIEGRKRTIESMMLGDGNINHTKTGDTLRYSTTSPQLADDFQELCILSGWGSTPRLRPKRKNRPSHHYPEYHCSLTKERTTSQADGDRNKSGFKRIAYNGYVYCAEMRTGLLYVRRNGKPMVCGNSKFSTRGQGSYDVNEQPSKGGGDLAQAKRLSGLETHALLSAGAYGVLRDMSTLRGQRNDEYWRSLRSGHEPRTPGIPFAFNKFHALLNGAGFHARKLPDGVERLSFWTDKDLDKVGSKEVKSGELVDPDTLEATPGGLFDDALTGNNSWGHISLPFKVPNPAAEKAIRKMLSLTEKQFRAIMAGEETMPPHLLMPTPKPNT